MKKIFTLLMACMAISAFAATEPAWYNDVTSITANGQYYIYSPKGSGFMQAGNDKIKTINLNTYNTASGLVFTIGNPNGGTVKSGNSYLYSYQAGSTCGPVHANGSDKGTNIVWTLLNNGAFWNIHSLYDFLGNRYAALYYTGSKYDAVVKDKNPISQNRKDTYTDIEYQWYVISPEHYNRHWAIYAFETFKEGDVANYTQYENQVPAAYYTALANAYNQTFSVQNAEHSADVVNAAKTTLEGLYNGAADVAAAYATANGAINTLNAVEDKGEDFAEITTDINNARTALEQAMTVEAINAAVSGLKAIDPITFNTTTFTALQAIGTPASSDAARAITYDAADKTIINAEGMALKAGSTTLTATAAATEQYYKFVRSAQVTVNKAQSVTVPVGLSFCQGGSETYRGTEYSAEGVYDVTAEGAVRDTVYKVTVTVLQPSTSQENKTIAYGAEESWNGIDLSTYVVGTHTIPFETTNVAGCDSTVTLNLTVTKQGTVNASVELSFCEGDSVEYRGETYTEAGTFPVYATGEVSDTLYTVTVTVNQPVYDEDERDILVGVPVLFEEDGWLVRGETPVQDGVYPTTQADTADLWFVRYTQTEAGCEAQYVLYVGIDLLDPVELEQELFFCPDDSVEFRGKWYSDTMRDTIYINDAICDTIIYVESNTLIIDNNVSYETVAAGDVFTLPEGDWYLGETLVTGQYETSEADVPMLQFKQYGQTYEGCEVATEIWLTVTSRQGIDQVSGEQSAEKFFQNGVLYIRRGERLFTTEGREVK